MIQAAARVLVASNVLASTPLPGAPGCHAYLGLPLLVAIPTLTGTGHASVPLNLPCGIPSGFVLATQWVIHTPGHNAFGWISSDDLDVSWSHF